MYYIMSSDDALWFFFFFSSRRRHTRCSRDWSSDVCSSDLLDHRGMGKAQVGPSLVLRYRRVDPGQAAHVRLVDDALVVWRPRWAVGRPVEVDRKSVV